VSDIDYIILIVVALPMVLGLGLIFLSTILSDQKLRGTVLTVANLINMASVGLTLSVIAFGAKGLLVPVIALAVLGMMYLSLGLDGYLEITLNRFKLSFQKLPPVEKDDPEPEREGKILKFERRPRDNGPRPL